MTVEAEIGVMQPQGQGKAGVSGSWKGQGMTPPREPWGECSFPNTLILDFWPPNLQRKHLCYLKPPSL